MIDRDAIQVKLELMTMMENIRHTIDFLEERYSATAIQVTFPRSGTAGNVGIEATINDPENKLTSSEMAKEIEALEETVFAIESI